VGEVRNLYKILVGKPEGNRLLYSAGNAEMEFTAILYDSVG
jgi:hypothetical protein